MNMGIVSLFFALFGSFAYVDARNAFVHSDAGKSAKDGFIFSFQESESPEFICHLCLDVSRKVEEVLTNPEIPEKFVLFAKDACHILPSDMRINCVEMLEGYAQQAIMFLQVFFDEENICNSTGICPLAASTLPVSILGKDQQLSYEESVRDLMSEIGGNSRLLTKLLMPFSELQRHIGKISGSKSCDACHNAMDDLTDMLDDPELKMKLIRILLKACENVENHVKQCKRMILGYGPLVLSEIEKYLKSNDLCSLVHICEASARHTSGSMESFDSHLELPSGSDDHVISK